MLWTARRYSHYYISIHLPGYIYEKEAIPGDLSGCIFHFGQHHRMPDRNAKGNRVFSFFLYTCYVSFYVSEDWQERSGIELDHNDRELEKTFSYWLIMDGQL